MGTPAAARWCKFLPASMSNRFVQRGGWWVVGQSLLMSVIGIMGVAGRTTLNLPTIFIGGLVLLVISAVCGVAGFLTFFAMPNRLTIT